MRSSYAIVRHGFEQLARKLVAGTALGICAGLACVSGAEAVEPVPEGGIHVLFVGNSLTYTNDLPATVAAIAVAAGDTVRVVASVGGDLGIIDHLNGGSDAVQQLKRGGWNYVVLQQGPTPAGVCRDSLVLWTKQFAPLI